MPFKYPFDVKDVLHRPYPKTILPQPSDKILMIVTTGQYRSEDVKEEGEPNLMFLDCTELNQFEFIFNGCRSIRGSQLVLLDCTELDQIRFDASDF